MHAKKTFLLILGFTTLNFILYFFAVDILAVPDRKVGKVYRYLLLDVSRDVNNKIIIASGSNALHGINASLLEKETGRFTINFSDNAGFPLNYRIGLLENYLNEGDVLLLPLEWPYYYDDDVQDIFVNEIFTKEGYLSFYFNHMKWYQKAHFVYSAMPFRTAFRHIRELNGLASVNESIKTDELRSLRMFAARVERNERGSHITDASAEGDERTVPCDQAIFKRHFGKSPFTAPRSRTYLQSLGMLADYARDKKIRVVFTWPSVVGYQQNDCYTTEFARQQLPEIARLIKDEINDYGFDFIGDYREAVYEHSCYKDTHYHVRGDCANAHTRKLISRLQEIGVDPVPGYKPEHYTALLNRRVDALGTGFIDTVQTGTRVTPDSFNRFLLLGQGWAEMEPWGIWSLGNTSTFRLRKPAGNQKELVISGNYFNGEEQTKVFINDTPAGAYVLTREAVPLGSLAADTPVIRVRLEHTDVRSPHDLGINPDQRKIKFGLTGIEFR